MAVEGAGPPAADGRLSQEAAKAMPVPEYADEEFAGLWMTVIGGDRSLDIPYYYGNDAFFEEFTWKFSRRVSGLPGEALRMLEASRVIRDELNEERYTALEKTISRRVATPSVAW